MHAKVPEVPIVWDKRKSATKGVRVELKHRSVPSAVLVPDVETMLPTLAIGSHNSTGTQTPPIAGAMQERTREAVG
jgi:hypothetical protein